MNTVTLCFLVMRDYHDSKFNVELATMGREYETT